MANLLSGPLFGLAFDYTRQTKLIVMFGNLFEIGGQYISAVNCIITVISIII